jgi:cytochrome c
MHSHVTRSHNDYPFPGNLFIRFTLATIILFMFSACTGEVIGVPEERNSSEANLDNGRQLIASYGCGSCHTIPGVPGADSMAAPPLEHFYERTYIAGRLQNTWANLILWIQAPQSVEPDTAMPNLGVSETEARDIAAYLYHEPDYTFMEWFRK